MSTVSTRSSGNVKIPLHFDETLSFSDWSGPKLIGKIQKGFTVCLVSIEVDTAFDGSAAITIGDDISQAILVSASDVYLDSVANYSIEKNVNYNAITDIKIYMLGNPTQGSANIWIYYQ